MFFLFRVFSGDDLANWKDAIFPGQDCTSVDFFSKKELTWEQTECTDVVPVRVN